MYDVACIGIFVADCIAKTVDKIPDRGKLGLIDSLSLYTGGCAMNAGADMKKLGADIALLGMVGNDGFGSFLLGEVSKLGMTTEGIKVSDADSTSASVVLVDGGGERTFLHCLGANGTFTETDINYDIIKDSKVVFVAGTMLMPNFDGEPCARFLKKCKEMGKITVLDSAWDDTGRWMDILRPCMPYIDYFIPSIDEARMFAEGREDVKDIADYFFDLGVKHVAIKVGKDGCYVRESKDAEGVTMPTYLGIKPVDTTGAGDSFCAGFLYGLTHGMSMTESAQFANAVATHCVMAVGASTGIRPYEEICRFMKENQPG
ncbi:MAG: carbohydrate kinase family protein [Ruminococcaceae bacterium]|nr:carbohydrate kinase family protein [Oscillospiraceae bacterium]